MADDAVQQLSLSPAPIAIHDDGDVARKPVTLHGLHP
jgi:hypothetical protein